MNVDMNNYEEWIVAYLDGELSPEEQQELEQFLDNHSDCKEELALYHSLQLAPDEAIVFDEKESLYKKESTLILLKKVWPLAAAIALLLAILPFLNNDPHTPEVVINEKKSTVDSPKQRIEVQTITPESVEQEPKQKTTQVAQVMVPPNKRKTKTITVNKPNKRKARKAVEQVKEVVPLKQLEETPEQSQYAREVPVSKPIESTKQPVKDQVIVEAPNKNEVLQPPAIKEDDTKSKKAIVVISEETTPVLHNKITEVVSKVEDNIETIKKLKKAPITVSIGRRKLFTINN